jgi:hypothetical protein
MSLLLTRIMAGSARPTFGFSEHNSRGGCSTENRKLFQGRGEADAHLIYPQAEG